MKTYITLLILICSLTSCKTDQITDQIVETSCGQCQFEMTGKGCDLAIRIEGNTYYVAGTKIDDHGDAHASDGFCETIKKAKVSGSIVDEKFIASSFKITD